MEVADQELAAPDRAVGAVTGAVERDADHRPRQGVLGHAARHVGVVVLHGQPFDALPRREVIHDKAGFCTHHFVRADRRANTTAANRDAPLHLAFRSRLCQRDYIVGVVIGRIQLIGA